MKKNKSIFVLAMVSLFMLGSSIVANAAVTVVPIDASKTPDRHFENWTIQANYGNSYLRYRPKQTNNQYSYVRITRATNLCNKITVWFEKNGNRLNTPYRGVGLSNYFTVVRYDLRNCYVSQLDPSTGSQKNEIRMAAENYYQSSFVGHVTGDVDYD